MTKLEFTLYGELLALQKENEKLKTENENLLDTIEYLDDELKLCNPFY